MTGFFMKKIRSSLCLIVIIIVGLTCVATAQHLTSQNKFYEVSRQILQSTYGEDQLSAHFSFLKPKQFGIHFDEKSDDGSTGILPCYEKEEYIQEKAELQKTLEDLRAIDSSKLSSQAEKTYHILVDYLKEKEKGCKYLYFDEPLSPTSGVHSSMPVLLSEYEMKTQQDVKSYLKLLESLPAYFDSLAKYEADKAEKGMFMASEDVDMVISQCDFMASEQGYLLFKACFVNNLNKLDSLTNQDRDYYIAQNERIFHTLVSKAYEKLGDDLLLLKESGKEQKGLWQYQDGKEYYAYRVQRLVGTDKTIDEIEKKLQIRLSDLYKELKEKQKIYQKNNELGNKKESCQTAVSENSYCHEKQEKNVKEEIVCLDLIKNSMDNCFPSLHSMGHVTIKQIPDALLDYTAPAYYFVPRIRRCFKQRASFINNIIYVNPTAKDDPINLFTTLAHEGYPGHMYQNMFFLNAEGVSEDNILRYCLDFPGYTEGWAMYVELMSYHYARQSLGESEEYLELLRISREIQLCMLSLLDIKIHDQGASFVDVAKVMSQIGITDAQTLHEVYSYIINEPGTYLKYYFGYLELLECRDLYQEIYGSKNDLAKVRDEDIRKREFHEFFLSHGPDSYQNIRLELQRMKRKSKG